MPINFDIRVNRTANFYFFVQNLASWEPWVRQAANDFWVKKLNIPDGVLGEAERLAEIHERHSGDPGTYYLGTPFYGEAEDPFSDLTAKVGDGEAEKVRRIFGILAPYFDRLWEEDGPLLEEWKERLSAIMNDRATQDRICPVLATAYGTDFESATVRVELTVSAPDTCGGRANFLDASTVRLEVSRLPAEKVRWPASVLWHETIHCLYDGALLKPAIRAVVGEDDPMMIHEVAANSFLPRGYLGQEVLGMSAPGPRYMSQLVGRAEEAIALARFYFDRGEALGEAYVREVKGLIESQD